MEAEQRTIYISTSATFGPPTANRWKQVVSVEVVPLTSCCVDIPWFFRVLLDLLAQLVDVSFHQVPLTDLL
jgi:hypothetical protein